MFQYSEFEEGNSDSNVLNDNANPSIKEKIQVVLHSKPIHVSVVSLYFFCILLHIYPPITTKQSMRYTSSLRSWELPAICLPRQDGGIPLSAFSNGTTSKLAGLFSTLPL